MQIETEILDKFESVGSINLNRKIMISDPCYKPGTWCTAVLDNIKPGNYKTHICKGADEIFECNDRIFAQLLIHEDLKTLGEIDPLDASIGVDSGVCGISDYDFFVETINNDTDLVYDQLIHRIKNPDYVALNDYPPHQKFMEEIKGLEMTDELEERIIDDMSTYHLDYKASTLMIQKYEDSVLFPHAIFTFSGYGDGSYTVYAQKDENDQIVALLLDFGLLSDDEEYEDDDDEL